MPRTLPNNAGARRSSRRARYSARKKWDPQDHDGKVETVFERAGHPNPREAHRLVRIRSHEDGHDHKDDHKHEASGHAGKTAPPQDASFLFDLLRLGVHGCSVNGGYWSVISSTAYASTRSDQRCTPTT